MEWLDLIIVIVAVLGTAKGLFDGIVKQVISLFSLLFAIAWTGKLSALLMNLVARFIGDEQIRIVLVYVVTFVLILIAGTILAYWIDKLVDSTPLSVFNHIFGGVLGLGLTLVILSFTIFLFNKIDSKAVLLDKKTRESSLFYKPVGAIVPTIYPKILLFTDKQVDKINN